MLINIDLPDFQLKDYIAHAAESELLFFLRVLMGKVHTSDTTMEHIGMIAKSTLVVTMFMDNEQKAVI